MISAYILNASGELTTGDIAGIMGTITPDSYGRSSPSTVYDINGACYIIATGYPTDVGYSIPNSYGIFTPRKSQISLSARQLRQRCVLCELEWCRQRRRLGYRPFLRATLRSICMRQKCMVSIWRVPSRKMAIFSLMKTVLWLSIPTEIYQFLTK